VHAGENLAIHFTDSGDVVQAWMDSPTHRANIMNGNYTEIGVGTAEGTYEGFDTVYVVQLFGTPARPTVAGDNTTTATEDPGQGSEPEVVLAQAEPGQENEVLAESAEITETTEFIPAEPVPVEVIEEAPEEAVPAGSTTDDVKEGTTSETTIVEMEATEHGVALYSDFVSTSTGGVPATVAPNNELTQRQQSTPLPWRLATQPHTVLQVLYMFMSLFVVTVLLLSIFIEIRKQHPVQIAYGVLMLLLMYGLFEFHTFMSGGALIL
jgi:hypothetical protein